MQCYQCSGEGGLCKDREDGGTALDCGEEVTTCTIAYSGQSGAWARGCGVKGDTSQGVTCIQTLEWRLCTCQGDFCNNLGKIS